MHLQLELFRELRARHLDTHKDELMSKYQTVLQEKASQESKDFSTCPEEVWPRVREYLLAQPVEDIKQVFNMELPTRSWRADMNVIKLHQVSFHYPTTSRQKALYTVYSALVNGGFTLTSGAIYGADFLAFKGNSG